jgi:acetyl-CoA carboxylase biotin carboxylase subunit
MVTGLDLVHMQLRVAMGEPLPVAQEDIHLRGHAVECRIYAEDPENNFFPSPGKITHLVQPGGPGIREDAGVYEGWVVPLDYDPLLSKLVTYGATREAAVDRMLRALGEYRIGGIKTNISMFRRILEDEDFRAARIDTGYLERLLARDKGLGGAARNGALTAEDVAVIAAALFQATERTAGGAEQRVVSQSAWTQAARRDGLRS